MTEDDEAALVHRRQELCEAATVAFLEECSRRYGLGWGQREIQGPVRAVNVVPAGTREAVAAELRRREQARSGSGGLLKER
jgi:hypothetical protein